MTTRRERVRDNRNLLLARARQKGVNIDDIKKDKQTVLATTVAAGAMMNDGINRPRRHQLVVDNPVTGACDGLNKTFYLSFRAQSSLNTCIIFVHQATGTAEVLTHSESSAPSVGSVYIQLPSTLTLGEAPAASDTIIAVYWMEN